MNEHRIKVTNKELGTDYEFFTGFSFAEAMESCGHNFDKVYLDIINREVGLSVVKDVICCALVKINGKDATSSEIDAEFHKLYMVDGYQDLSSFASMLVLHSVRSSEEKKSLIFQMEVMETLSEKVKYSTLKNFFRLGWRWILVLTTFTSAASVTLSLLAMHLWQSTV